jgi:hypothetical protein
MKPTEIDVYSKIVLLKSDSLLCNFGGLPRKSDYWAIFGANCISAPKINLTEGGFHPKLQQDKKPKMDEFKRGRSQP